MQKDPVADALFIASLAAASPPGAAGRPDPALDAAVQAALDRLPALVEHRDRLDDWAPLLKVSYGDVLAGRAAERLQRMLGARGIKCELRPNPWMMDMSKYLFVDVDSVANAAQGAAK